MTTTLPQLGERLFLTDGGLETTLIFHEGIELPHFAAFMLLKDARGRMTLRRYYERYLQIAADQRLGFILEAPTWRASPDWAARLGLAAGELELFNRDAIRLLHELAAEWRGRVPQVVVSGCVGPRGDGYDPGEVMNAEEARRYHAGQVASFAAAGAEMVCAITMTNAPEAIGVVRAAHAARLPVAISFTVETDGALPTGQPLGEAISAVDAATAQGPAYYMVNCAHPSHFAQALETDAPWVARLRGLRANASRRSHQELNDAPDLDDGNPAELGQEHAALLRRHRHIRVLGGCCGTDHRHVAAMSRACLEVSA
ncbi:homocysteine S-methyltransferase family protein [uncultured Phenylobacterium sp.]|uniref:homocysteine S-methyltransferase family protein n=1 Tax=uncultured Phenylobacterium sp. TaxID=349273 RepID=UPI0025FF78AC|nr:homocysteine S-methyltransferase family protein [uncultured Phenylobacterium sp.]